MLRVGSGTIGTRRPMARPSPNETPTRSPVKDPGPLATATLVTGRARTSSLSCSRSRRGEVNSWTSAPSMVATVATAGDDVSMIKIMFSPDQAAVPAEVLDVDQRGAVDLQPVAPLDDDRAAVGKLV